jgi:hypothetical protein
MMQRALALDPRTYERHPIHGDARIWAETNCYVDLWIELLHALGHDPVAALPFTVAIDFEGDQWTFFKFPLNDLFELYDLDVQELQLWRPLPSHIEEQVGRGRPVLVELDSYFLPDTAGTAYGCAHVKTTVAAVEIDTDRRHLGYFHGQGFHHLDGDDFVDALRMREPKDPSALPPYAEFVKVRSPRAEDDGDLLSTSLGLLRKHLRLAPSTNPFNGFRARFSTDLPRLLTEDLEQFHQYSFATLRQYGACYELTATYLDWLIAHGEPVRDARDAFQSLSERTKAFQFQLARAMTRRKPLDLSTLDEVACLWERGVSSLTARYLGT